MAVVLLLVLAKLYTRRRSLGQKPPQDRKTWNPSFYTTATTTYSCPAQGEHPSLGYEIFYSFTGEDERGGKRTVATVVDSVPGYLNVSAEIPLQPMKPAESFFAHPTTSAFAGSGSAYADVSSVDAVLSAPAYAEGFLPASVSTYADVSLPDTPTYADVSLPYTTYADVSLPDTTYADVYLPDTTYADLAGALESPSSAVYATFLPSCLEEEDL